MILVFDGSVSWWCIFKRDKTHIRTVHIAFSFFACVKKHPGLCYTWWESQQEEGKKQKSKMCLSVSAQRAELEQIMLFQNNSHCLRAVVFLNFSDRRSHQSDKLFHLQYVLIACAANLWFNDFHSYLTSHFNVWASPCRVMSLRMGVLVKEETSIFCPAVKNCISVLQQFLNQIELKCTIKQTKM